MLAFLGLSSGGFHPGWPEATPAVCLEDGARLRLRALRSGDGFNWVRYRIADERWLKPVEPTVPTSWAAAHTRSAWRSTYSNLRRLALDGVVVPLVIELDGRFAGQVTLGNIQHGSVSECWIGYWVHSAFMGRGVATAACALGTDHAFGRVGMHRVTATYLPDNPASGKVLVANGYRQEGYMRRNLHIDGQWRDHHFVALNADDYHSTALARLIAEGRVRRG
ncbi:N-acetyltransferase [Corynebacterium sanguinis]|uniref:GNAT family N-acetyltransferase n=1 Tax=Corynebacterium sanguinis TaxID=2594913 RepID=UPI0011A8ABC2|nr:GNAT family protein [Corynebacterium sanguinis]TVS23717.1 N-acetyltransferase [Corynebacterium sanguinis]TVS27038.1 N-acetyltransferase [Corynebacterium sanguinis]